MNEKLKSLRKYPITLLFLSFLLVYSLVDTIVSNREFSELENRKLNQAPPFTISAFVNNEWTKAFGEYTKDQFIFRDQWIFTHSFFETVQGKLEIGGVWLARDQYQIAKNDIFSQQQQSLFEQNTTAISQLAARHPGQVSVMIVPSPANILSGKLRYNPPQMDENQLLEDAFASFRDAGANVVDLRSRLLENADNPIFYRTDHHWTTLGGSRLAYEAFCESQNLPPLFPEESFLRQQTGFKGRNFAKTLYPFTRADTIDYYDLPNNLAVYKYQPDGSLTSEDGPIMDTGKFETLDKYGAFLRGNNGYSVLDGNGTGSILVFKDSFGNAFVPYLVEQYEKIGIVDLRSWHYVDRTFTEGEYDSILVLYSFPSFIQDTYIYRMMDANQK